LCDKATTRVNDCSVVRRAFAHDKVHKRSVLVLERAAVQLSVGIESEHLVHEANDLAGNSVAKLNDCLHHTHSLSGEARHAVAFRIVEHARELHGC
jgi:hypothetical protein